MGSRFSIGGKYAAIGKIAIGVIVALFPLYGLSQPTRIELQDLTTLDEPSGFVSIFTSAPSEHVILPVDTAGATFFTVYYSGDVTDDPVISVMRTPRSGGDELFIDLNYDNDLSNDGPPIFFSKNQNAITFDISYRSDPKQKVRILVARKRVTLDQPDSIVTKTMDAIGNLTPEAARMFGRINGSVGFKGEVGTFYWNDRVALRRGTVSLDGKSYAIGLFDWNNNGLYTDKSDRLIVDLHGTGKLTYTDQSQVFKPNDVFPIAGRSFKISGIDKYGTWIEIDPTVEKVFRYFSSMDSSNASNQILTVDPAFWALSAKTVAGGEVSLRAYKGKYLLLNFWGEWCRPCIDEIPSLVEQVGMLNESRIQFVSFLKTYNVKKAKEIIETKGMKWPQLTLESEAEERFRIYSYPANLLILPNGRECVWGIDVHKLQSYIK